MLRFFLMSRIINSDKFMIYYKNVINIKSKYILISLMMMLVFFLSFISCTNIKNEQSSITRKMEDKLLKKNKKNSINKPSSSKNYTFKQSNIEKVSKQVEKKAKSLSLEKIDNANKNLITKPISKKNLNLINKTKNLNLPNSKNKQNIQDAALLRDNKYIRRAKRGIAIVAEDTTSNQWIEIPLYTKTYAVIIGIDRYPSLSHDNQLSYAVSDAKAVENLIKNKFVFNKIYSLYNEQATKNNILDILLNKMSKISENDAVFVFFAGHGGEEETNFGPIGYIVPYDGDFLDMRKVISMTTIRDDISKRIKAKHVFYVMDACYSGILVTTRGNKRKINREIDYLKQLASEPVRQVLTAGSADQKVLDGGPFGHSVFTGRFLEILDKSNDYITASEICSVVKERVFSDAKSQGYIQTPKSGELFGLGDFIFMPSFTKQIGSIQDQIKQLEFELNGLKIAEKKVSANNNLSALREIERKARIAEAKLQAKRLEEKRIKEEELNRIKHEKERQEAINLRIEKQKLESERLLELQKEVMEKRKKYKISMVSSLEEALNELKTLEKDINVIRDQYRNEFKNRIWSIIKEHSNNYNNIKLKKDEFETNAEYQQRLSQSGYGKVQDNKKKFMAELESINNDYNRQIKPLIEQIINISQAEYTLYGHDSLKLSLGNYNAERESFSITIASANIKRSIYPYQYFQIISKTGRHSLKVGLQKGDMLLKYNADISNGEFHLCKKYLYLETA